jgi:hypothetical protein
VSEPSEPTPRPRKAPPRTRAPAIAAAVVEPPRKPKKRKPAKRRKAPAKPPRPTPVPDREEFLLAELASLAELTEQARAKGSFVAAHQFNASRSKAHAELTKIREARRLEESAQEAEDDISPEDLASEIVAAVDELPTAVVETLYRKFLERLGRSRAESIHASLYALRVVEGG